MSRALSRDKFGQTPCFSGPGLIIWPASLPRWTCLDRRASSQSNIRGFAGRAAAASDRRGSPPRALYVAGVASQFVATAGGVTFGFEESSGGRAARAAPKGVIRNRPQRPVGFGAPAGSDGYGSAGRRLRIGPLGHAAYRPAPARELARRGAVGDRGPLAARGHLPPPGHEPLHGLGGVVLYAQGHVGARGGLARGGRPGVVPRHLHQQPADVGVARLGYAAGAPSLAAGVLVFVKNFMSTSM